jgi:hypothetical protein
VQLSRACLKRLTALSWLAVFALTLLPSLARVVNAATPGGWVQVCSAQGMRWVAPDGSLSELGPDGQRASPGEHCPLCGGGGAVALPTPTVASRPVAFSTDFTAAQLVRAPRLLFVWSSAQPRAPPPLA